MMQVVVFREGVVPNHSMQVCVVLSAILQHNHTRQHRLVFLLDNELCEIYEKYRSVHKTQTQ
jgi:hypothetical protein